MGCQRLHIAAVANEERISIAVLGIENLDEFVQLLETCTVKYKEKLNSRKNQSDNMEHIHRIPNSSTVESCLNGYHYSSPGTLAVNPSTAIGVENPVRVVKENDIKEKPAASEISPIVL